MTIVSVETPIGVVYGNSGCEACFRVFPRRISGKTLMVGAMVRDENDLAMVRPSGSLAQRADRSGRRPIATLAPCPVSCRIEQ